MVSHDRTEANTLVKPAPGGDEGSTKVVFNVSREVCSVLSSIASPLGYSTVEALVCVSYALLVRYEGAEKPPSVNVAFAKLHQEENSDTSSSDSDEVIDDEEYSTVSLPCDVNGQISDLLQTLRSELDKSYTNVHAKFSKSNPNVFMAFNLPREFEKVTLPTKFAMKLDMILQSHGDYNCTLSYSSLCQDALPQRFRDHFLMLVLQLSALQYNNPNMLGLPMQTPEEELFLQKYNDTSKSYTRGKWLMHELFEETAKEFPDATSVTCGDVNLTYHQLEERSSALAEKIVDIMGHDYSSRLIGISVDASIEMVVGLYAIMKAGFAYVPLDPSYPEERLSYMIENSETSLVLAKKAMVDVLKQFCRNVICLNDVLDQTKGDEAKQTHGNLTTKHSVKPDDLAYIIYTSGSTGRPKGVMISHRNAVNTLLDMNERYNVTEKDKILLVASLSFDLSVYDIFGMLATGGTIVIPVPEVRGVPDPACWIATMRKEGVTFWDSAPAVLSLLVEYLHSEGESLPSCLRLVVLSGDRIPLVLPTHLQSMVPGIQVMSQGGATEGSIWSIYYPIGSVDPAWTTIPYGRPLTNQKYYVLDEFMNPVPTMVTGELYIGGTGVAMGYMNNSKVTSFRFLQSHFVKGDRIYKTGDLGRFHPDGYIEFCGRIDNQVKIRGFRVELSEIESALIGQDGVSDALVMKVHEKLVAYVIRKQHATLHPSDLQMKIGAVLPSYMVPGFIIIMDSFPVTANGKVDRRALPDIESVSATLDADQGITEAIEQVSITETISFSEREQVIAAVWSETFHINIQKLNQSTSFFEIGGDSISAMTVVSAVRKRGLRLSVQQVLGQSSLSQLALVAKPVREHKKISDSDRLASSPFVSLTPAQIWFFEQEFENPNFWNQSFLLQPKVFIERKRLSKALSGLVSNHEMLRCTYTKNEGGCWIQTINQSQELQLVYKVLDCHKALDKEMEDLQKSLSISKGPLIAAGLFNIGEEQRVFVTIHHLVVDLVSWRIILEDLERQYNDEPTEKTTLSFQKWSSELRIHANKLTNKIWPEEGVSFPIYEDFIENVPTASTRRTAFAELGYDITTVLTTSANDAFRTNTTDMLLSSLILAYNEAFGKTNLQIDIEAHGREPWDDSVDISRTVGWFMTMFPMKLEVLEGQTPEKTMENTLKLMKEKVRSTPQRGLPFWLLKFLKASDETSHQKSEVLFNYYGRFDQIQTKSDFWDIADNYPCGEDEFGNDEKLTHKLVIECCLKDERLHMKMFYCSNIHSSSTIESWLSKWKTNLTNLVQYCSRGDAHGYTPSDFPLLKLSQSHLDNVLSTRLGQLDLHAEHVSDMYPCTPMQEGFLFSLLQDPTAYLIQRTCTIGGTFSQTKLKNCVSKVIQRHDILRSRFIVDRLNGCMQIVRKTFDPQWTVDDWSTVEDYSEKEERHMQHDRHTGFDISEPMLRFGLFRQTNEKHRFIMTSHHSLVDGLTCSLFLKEIVLAYNESVLPDVPKYREYIEEVLDYEKMAYKAEGFWKEEMHELPDLGNLRFLPPEDVQRGHAIIHQTIMTGKMEELASYAEKNDVSIAAILCASWAFVLNRYSCDPNDVIFGFVVSGRGTSHIENINAMVGLTINTLPMRVKIHDHHVAEWLKYIQGKLSTIIEKEKSFMTDIQKWCDLNPADKLFDTVVSYQTVNTEIESTLTTSSLKMNNVYDHEFTEYPLTLDVLNTGSAIEVKAIFDSKTIDKSALFLVLDHLERAMSSIITSTQEDKVSGINLMSTEERLLINTFNPENNYQQDLGQIKSVAQLVEEKVRALPNGHIALEKEGCCMTYNEMNNAANCLAKKLRSLGLKREEKVGLILDREMTMPIAMLGIWKSGGVFVSIDATLPADRICFVLEDSDCRFAVNASSLRVDDLPKEISYISLDSRNLKDYTSSDCENPTNVNEPHDVAYMIYTSGTTGLPKGAMVEHQGLINFLMYKPGGILNITKNSRVMQYFAVGFDGAVGEIFCTLCHGGCLVIPAGDFTATMKLVDTVGNTPSTLNILNPGDYPNLKVVLAAGEPCSQAMVNVWGRHKVLLNGYGPTECSVISHTSRLIPNKRVTVGEPLPNTVSYILDSSLSPVPLNVTGDLYIGGVNVGRGYHNRPDLTEKAFVENPFGGTRIYKTGDLARWLKSGEIEIIGRKDHQVKIRGKRVELEEVKAAIEQHPGVNQVHATVQDKQYIVGYVMSKIKIKGSDVLSRLKKVLPNYMLPTAVICMDNFPLTSNKKIDQRALPKFVPKTTHYKGRIPCNHLETLILDAYRDIVDPNFNLDDDFYALGGHSLLAISLKAFLVETCGLEVSMTDIMSFATPAELSDDLSNRMLAPGKMIKGHGFIPKTCPIEEGVITAPVSYRQDQMCLLYELIPHSPVYNVAVILNFIGQLQIDALKSSLIHIAKMHQAFRTSFKRLDDNSFCQRIASSKDYELKFDYHDSSEKADVEGASRNLIYEEAAKPFNLYSTNLARFVLVKLANGTHKLLILMHHSVTDGASVKIIVDQLSECYNSILNNSQPNLPPQKLNYVDYSNWERKMLEGGEMERQVSFWKQQLENVSTILELPLDRSRPAIPTYKGATVFFDVPDHVTRALTSLALTCGGTLFTSLVTVYAALIRIYCQVDDIVVGAFFSGRHNPGTEDIVGYFVNTLPLRVRFDKRANFRSILNKVKDLMIDVLDNQDVPFQKILESLKVPRDTSYHPIIQAATVLQEGVASRHIGKELDMQIQAFDQFTAKFDLNLEFLRDSNGQLSGHFVFNTDIFNRSTIERMSQHLLYLLELLPANCDTPMGQLNQLPPQQIELIRSFNSRGDFTQVRIHQLFEQRVEVEPDDIAVEEKDRHITYKRLNAAMNNVARRLRNIGVGPETPVALVGERNLEFIASKFGILKAGGAFVCIESSLPRDRIAFMLSDCETTVAVTTSKIKKEGVLGDFKGRIVIVDVEKYTTKYSEDTFDQEDYINLENLAGPHDLAWIVYTSGTTGKPKGVMVEHIGCESLIPRCCEAYGIVRGTRVTHFFNIMFDGAYQEVFMALTTGATLVLREQNYVKTLKTVDFSMMTPTVLASLDPADFPSLKTVSVAGEILPESVVAKWEKHVDLFNEYGPSEITIICTIGLTNGKPRVTVGRTVVNCAIHLLDENLMQVPIGVRGTMYLGGNGVARGYLKRPDLTHQKFVKNPFGEGRLYNSGDLGSWTEHGELIVAGRKDRQVKLRAFRVELDEVEHALRMQEGIKNAAVVVKQSILVGYVMPDIGSSAAFQMKLKLEETLPRYMVPSVIVPVEEFPMSTAEKINYKLLPEPNLTQHEILTKKEKILMEIWSEVLKIDHSRIKSTDSFFYLGGDSISAMKVFSLGRKRNLRFTVQQVFQTRSLAQLANVAKFDVKKMTTAKKIVNAEVSGFVPLTPIQEWFVHLNLKNRNCFNQSLLLRPLLHIEPESLQNAVGQLVTHHDILRASFSFESDGKVLQEIKSVSKAPTPRVIHKSIREDDISNEITKLQNSLDLKSGPLMAVGLFNVTGQRQFLFITIHHVAVDLVSWQIILEDLETLCRGGDLQQKTSSFKEWSELLINDYAPNIGTDVWPALEKSSPLKVDFLQYGRELVTCDTRTMEKIRFDVETTNKLLSLRGTHGSEQTSANDVLLTALMMAYHQCSSETSLSIEQEWHGREPWTDKLDVSRTVGWFTVMYPVTLAIDPNIKDCDAHLKGIKERLRQIPQQGLPYGVMRYLKKDQDARYNKTCDVVFNYHGSATQFSSENSLWEVCTDGDYMYNNQCKDERVSHSLVIECNITDGCLQGVFLFSKILHRRETIQLLTVTWKKAVEDIIASIDITPSLPQERFSFTNAVQDNRLLSIESALKVANIKLEEIEDVYECTPLQEGFIFSLLQDKSSYLVQYTLNINGNLDIEKFKRAWVSVIEHHPALRTSFVIDPESHNLRQVVRRHADPTWEVGVWTDITKQEALFVETNREKGFNMNDVLMRFALLNYGHEKHRFIWSFHHSLVDGWSGPLVLKDVLDVYHSIDISPAPAFRMFVEYCKTHSMSVAENFWSDYLENLQPKRLLALQETSKIAEPGHDDRDLMRRFTVRLEEMKQFARRNFLTTTSVMYGAWALVLDRYSSTYGNDIIFAVVMASRSAEVEGIEDMVGLLLNTLPLRITMPSNDSVTLIDWLTTIQSRQAAIMAYDHSNLADIKKWSGLPRDQGLFDTLVTYENYPALDNVDNAEIEMCDIKGYERIQPPLGILFAEDGEFLMAKCMYDAHCISNEFALQMLDHLNTALVEMLRSDNTRSVRDIDIIGESDVNQPHSDIYGLIEEASGIEKIAYHVIDQNERPCPPGVAGKISISARNALTNEARLYPGVVAQWGPNGRIHVLVDNLTPGIVDEVENVNKCYVKKTDDATIVFTSPRNTFDSVTIGLIKSNAETEGDPVMIFSVDEIMTENRKLLEQITEKTTNQESPSTTQAWTNYNKVKETLTPEETILRDMWSHLLSMKAKDIKLDHSFFDLGGTSIMAISMVSLGEKRGLLFNLIDVIQLQTVADIAAVAQIKQDEGDILVCLNKGEEGKTPIVCIHASDGGTSSYAYIAGHLRDHPLYAFRFLEGVTPFDSVDQLASFYVERMAKLPVLEQNNSYVLIGYSSGGAIAFDMALKLEEMNKSPETLVLLDGTPEFVTKSYSNILGSSEEQLAKFEQWFRDTWKEKGLDDEDLKVGLSIFRGTLKNYASYAPKSIYSGHTLFVRATELLTDGPLAAALAEVQKHGRDYGTQRLCSKPVTTIDVAGDHYTMMRDETKTIARAIVGQLEL